MRNTPTSDPIEVGRAILRDEVARSSVRAVAKRLGVDHSRLGAFVDGDTQRPRGAILAAVLDIADGRDWGGQPVATDPGAADGGESTVEPSARESVRADDRTRSPAYAAGRAEGYAVAQVQSARRFVALIQQAAGEALRDLDGLLASGALPDGALVDDRLATPMPRREPPVGARTAEDAEELLAELEAEERAMEQRRRPA